MNANSDEIIIVKQGKSMLSQNFNNDSGTVSQNKDIDHYGGLQLNSGSISNSNIKSLKSSPSNILVKSRFAMTKAAAPVPL